MYVHGALIITRELPASRARAGGDSSSNFVLTPRSRERLRFVFLGSRRGQARTRHTYLTHYCPVPTTYCCKPSSKSTHHTTNTAQCPPHSRVRARAAPAPASIIIFAPASQSSSHHLQNHLRTFAQPRHAHIDPSASKPEKFEASPPFGTAPVPPSLRPPSLRAFEPEPPSHAYPSGAKLARARAREARGEKGRSPREPRGPPSASASISLSLSVSKCMSLSARMRAGARPRLGPRFAPRADADLSKHIHIFQVYFASARGRGDAGARTSSGLESRVSS